MIGLLEGGQYQLDGKVYAMPKHGFARHSTFEVIATTASSAEFRLSASEANPELVDFTRRAWIATALSVPLLAISMVAEMIGIQFVPPAINPWVQLALTAPIVLRAGKPFFQRGWKSIVTWHHNMFTLVSIGVGAAFAYSLVATTAPGLFPRSFQMHGIVPVYYEAAGVVVTLVLLGQVLELRARAATGQAIRSLMNLAPKIAHRLRENDTEQEVGLAEVATGDRLRVRPGEAIPVDGIVVEGKSKVDESKITGEPAPVLKGSAAPVTGGTNNGTGSLVVEARAVGPDTVLARMVKMVAEAQRSRAPIQAIADRVASWFVPLVVGIAALTFVAWNPSDQRPSALQSGSSRRKLERKWRASGSRARAPISATRRSRASINAFTGRSTTVMPRNSSLY